MDARPLKGRLIQGALSASLKRCLGTRCDETVAGETPAAPWQEIHGRKSIAGIGYLRTEALDGSRKRLQNRMLHLRDNAEILIWIVGRKR